MIRYFIILIIFFSSFLITNCYAFTNQSLVNMQVPDNTLYMGTFDNLVMDFSLIATSPDIIKAISLSNLGTATYISQIKDMKIWIDSGDIGFQGQGIDQLLGDLNYTSFNRSWYISNLSLALNDRIRFFVTVDSFSSFIDTGTIKMSLPVLVDKNKNESFDVGDLGIFMDSGKNGPVDNSIINSKMQIFSTLNIDLFNPQIRLLNVAEGDIITTNNFILNGFVRDQGIALIKECYILINDEKFKITNINTQNYTWQYDWLNIPDGEYTIQLQAKDISNNFIQTKPILITVKNQPVSIANSLIELDKTIVSNSGIDQFIINVDLKDADDLPVTNREIMVVAPDMYLDIESNKTNDQGAFEARLSSTVSGFKTIVLTTDNQVLKRYNVYVNLADSRLLPGDLIKIQNNQSVYYYGADEKRYVFPDLNTYYSWYDDFSHIKTVSEEQLNLMTMGGIITYRPGSSLVKLTTDPKVYAIGQNGGLKWITNEQVASGIYGDNWNSQVMDVPDSFFYNYTILINQPIEKITDYNLVDIIKSYITINIDKGLNII